MKEGRGPRPELEAALGETGGPSHTTTRRETLALGLSSVIAGGIAGRLIPKFEEPVQSPPDNGSNQSSEKNSFAASDYGIVGDGRTDDGPALNRLLESARPDGGIVTFSPNSILLVSVPIQLPSNTRLELNGSTLLSGTAGDYSSTLVMQNENNVAIANGTIDGNMAQHSGQTEWRHGLSIHGSSHVLLENMKFVRHKGDGIYLGASTGHGELPSTNTNVTLRGVSCSENYRQGMSIITVSGLRASDSDFSSTSGTNPQSGVDIEPNADADIVENITFTSCNFVDNAGFGAVISMRATPTANQSGVLFVGCRFESNSSSGIGLQNASEVRVTNCSINGNQRSGVIALHQDGGVSKVIQIVASDIKGNDNDGITIAGAFSDLSVIGCEIHDNGLADDSGSTFSGVDVKPAVKSESVQLIANRIHGRSHHAGIRTNSRVSHVIAVGNSLAGNRASGYSLSDDVRTRTSLDAGALNIHDPLQISVEPGMTAIEVSSGEGDAKRVSVRDGSIAFSDQTTTTKIFSSISGALQTNGMLVAESGLGVGNSKLATDAGPITRAFEVFDETGRSLGFVPVHRWAST